MSGTVSDLALKGVLCVLTVDPYSNEVVNLYLTSDVWKYLVTKFHGNKMMVTLRAPHDYTRTLRMPPDVIIEKIVTWKKEDGTSQGLRDIIDDILEDEER